MAANLVNNANSNNNNNNNNNKWVEFRDSLVVTEQNCFSNNNDNVNNFNIANNNNAGNNMNDIQICPFPCLPQPPPVGRRKRTLGSLTYDHLVRNVTDTRPAEEDIRIVTMMLIELVLSMERTQYRALDTLQQDFIGDLASLNIGLAGVV